MNKRQCAIALVLGLVLGTGVTVLLNGPGTFTTGRSTGSVGAGVATYAAEPLQQPTIPSPAPTAASSPAQVPPDPTPTRIPLQVGEEKEEDLEDVLVLCDSTRVDNFEINFCKMAEYYGLLCKKVALDNTDLTDQLLRDTQGNYFKLVGISATTLLGSPSLLTNDELDVIQAAIETGGLNLLVSKMHEELDPAILVDLTDGAVLGVTTPQDASRDWLIASSAPAITREFTGQVISSTSTVPQRDFALTLGAQVSVTTLISSTSDVGTAYPIFVRRQKGLGSVFVDAGEERGNLEIQPLIDIYYSTDSFSTMIPLMFTMRYASGHESWHNDHNYANLTIDDPALTEPWRNLSYTELLRQMKTHNFHTTIAFVPINWNKSERTVVDLFRENPDHYSLVQHGNNHDGYEFYKYQVSEDEEYEGQRLTARPLADQEMDIVEGLARMATHEELTGVPHGRIMIFPWGIAPEPTLVLLKRHNYLATVNDIEVPLGMTRPPDWDYGMYQASMNFGNFPSVSRWCYRSYENFRPQLQYFAFDLFVDKPLLLCTHAGEGYDFGTGRMDAFNPIADQVNAIAGYVEWRSLEYIIKHLYLEKTNDDGSVDVKMYGNHLIVSNESTDAKTYHVAKEETLNVPIALLTVNGHEFPYHVEDGLLTLDILVPAVSSPEIIIQYAGDVARS
jgi:hypothetical protein